MTDENDLKAAELLPCLRPINAALRGRPEYTSTCQQDGPEKWGLCTNCENRPAVAAALRELRKRIENLEEQIRERDGRMTAYTLCDCNHFLHEHDPIWGWFGGVCRGNGWDDWLRPICPCKSFRALSLRSDDPRIAPVKPLPLPLRGRAQ